MCLLASSWASSLLDKAPSTPTPKQHDEHHEQTQEEQSQHAAVLTDRTTAAQETKNQGLGTDKYQQLYGREEFISDLVVCFVVPDVYGDTENNDSTHKKTKS